jgi:predicted permease
MLAHHLRYTLRSFRKNPGFAVIAVLSLALGIGANTAIFSLLDRVLLRLLPVRNPEQLVLFTANGPRRGSVNTQYDDTYTFSYPMYRDFRDRAPGLNGVIAWFPIAASFSLNGTTERVNANLVSGNFFEVLGVGTALGRPITPDDARASGSAPVAVLSYSFWQQRFGGNADVLNQQINLDGQPLTVVGVAARGFNGVAMGEAPAAFVPLTMKPQLMPDRADMESRRTMWLNVMGRLKMGRLRPGATRQSVEAALNVFWKPILEDEVTAIARTTAAFRQRFIARRITLADASNGISALRLFFREPLILLMALVGLVLLIACANVANLLIARAAGRQKEIAIRLSVGATRGDIVRQILTESLMLAAAGGALGMALATWGGRVLIGFMPFTEITAAISADPDWRILGFTAAVAILCGIVFGLAPALQTTRPDLASALKEQAGAVLGSGVQVRLRKGLVVAQVALSLLLLTGAGLFLRSLGNLKGVDLGFRADHLMSFTIQPALSGYTPQRSIALFDALRQRAAGMPGVRSVAATQTPLLANENWDVGITVPGYEPKENENAPNVTAVSPGYFAALGMPLAAGREFREGDNAAAPRVAVVNQTFAQVYFGGQNPIGRQFYFTADAQHLPVEIIGVAKDGKYADVREERQRFVFCPYAQQYSSNIGGMTYYVRTSQDPESLAGALRQVVREADANLPVYNLKTMERQIDEDVFADRMVSALSAFFGLLATVLAAIGLYGVMSYTVTRRTREIGIRMALGASRRDVLRIVLGEVALLAAIGIAIAAPLSFPLASLAKSMLYGVAPHDAAVLAGAAALLAFTALAAGYIPAARAARVDPLTALRRD